MENSILLIIGILVGVVSVLTGGAIIGIVMILKIKNKINIIDNKFNDINTVIVDSNNYLEQLIREHVDAIYNNEQKLIELKSNFDSFISKNNNKFKNYENNKIYFTNELREIKTLLTLNNENETLNKVFSSFFQIYIDNFPDFNK